MGLFRWLFRRWKKPSDIVILRNGMKCCILDRAVVAAIGDYDFSPSGFKWVDGERLQLVSRTRNPLTWKGFSFGTDYDVVSYG